MTQFQPTTPTLTVTTAPLLGLSADSETWREYHRKTTQHPSLTSVICSHVGYIILKVQTLAVTRRNISPTLTLSSLSSTALSGCTLNRQDVRLTLHYEKGFTVTREPADPAGGAVLYRYPYEKLKMSADDGIRNLYLDFGGPEGEMVRLRFSSVFDIKCALPQTLKIHK